MGLGHQKLSVRHLTLQWKSSLSGDYPTVSPLSVHMSMKSMQGSIKHSKNCYLPPFYRGRRCAAKRDCPGQRSSVGPAGLAPRMSVSDICANNCYINTGIFLSHSGTTEGKKKWLYFTGQDERKFQRESGLWAFTFLMASLIFKLHESHCSIFCTQRSLNVCRHHSGTGSSRGTVAGPLNQNSLL